MSALRTLQRYRRVGQLMAALSAALVISALAFVSSRPISAAPASREGQHQFQTPTASSPSTPAPGVALSPHFPLTTVDNALLKWDGITLSDASGSATVISAKQAEAAVFSRRPDAQIRELALTSVQNRGQTPAYTSLCWVISIVPPPHPPSLGAPGHPMPPQSARSFDLFVVDANSGAFLFELYGDPAPGF